MHAPPPSLAEVTGQGMKLSAILPGTLCAPHSGRHEARLSCPEPEVSDRSTYPGQEKKENMLSQSTFLSVDGARRKEALHLFALPRPARRKPVQSSRR